MQNEFMLIELCNEFQVTHLKINKNFKKSKRGKQNTKKVLAQFQEMPKYLQVKDCLYVFRLHRISSALKISSNKLEFIVIQLRE